MNKFDVLIWLFCLILVSQSHCAKASTLEVIEGGVTYHVVNNQEVSQKFSRPLSSDGRLIATPLFGMRYTFDEDIGYQAVSGFVGSNSINSPITGITYSVGIGFEYLNLGLINGFYMQNDHDFEAKGIQPYSLNGGSNAIVPIIGLECNFKIPLKKDLFFGFNNILTPVITTHNISLGFKL